MNVKKRYYYFTTIGMNPQTGNLAFNCGLYSGSVFSLYASRGSGVVLSFQEIDYVQYRKLEMDIEKMNKENSGKIAKAVKSNIIQP